MIAMLFFDRTFRGSILLIALVALQFTYALTLFGDEPAKDPQATKAAEEFQRRRLAVALNYCKASFHRITKHPTHEVLREEQRKILNNLDLSSIDEVQVITLYTSVIDEINQIELVDREREIIDEFHKRTFRQKLFLNSLQLGSQVATFNYVGAVQSGVGSWWDYRSSEWGKENETWKLDKNHLNTLSKKTTEFIETSWKLARSRNLPDEWLVRDIDLEQLEKTLAEKDLATRLRILKRMESRMQCYPPYFYYVARTEQSLGQLPAASETYQKLQKLQTGHFRRDEMLAAALSNLAAIQHSQHLVDARETARQALAQSTDVWEANLVCANILAEYGEFSDAEDAVYRNLDTNLEQEASRNSLALLYTRSGESAKLAKLMDDTGFVASLKGPVLLQCARSLGDHRLSAIAAQQLQESFQGRVNVTFGRDDLILTASDDWRLEAGLLEIAYGGVALGRPEVIRQNGKIQLVYRGILEVGTPWRVTQATRPISVQVQFPEQPAIAFELHPGSSERARQTLQLATAAPKPGAGPAPQQGYVLTDIRSEQFALAMDGSPARNFVDPKPSTIVPPMSPLVEPAPVRTLPQFLPAGQTKENPPTEAETLTKSAERGPVELMFPE